MAFIQIIEVQAKNLDKLQAIDQDWEKATEGKRTARRSILTTDRNDPSRHLVIVFFDSYESAMENSNLPETAEFSSKWAEAVDGPITFHDLDVVDDRL